MYVLFKHFRLAVISPLQGQCFSVTVGEFFKYIFRFTFFVSKSERKNICFKPKWSGCRTSHEFANIWRRKKWYRPHDRLLLRQQELLWPSRMMGSGCFFAATVFDGVVINVIIEVGWKPFLCWNLKALILKILLKFLPLITIVKPRWIEKSFGAERKNEITSWGPRRFRIRKELSNYQLIYKHMRYIKQRLSKICCTLPLGTI